MSDFRVVCLFSTLGLILALTLAYIPLMTG